MLRAGLCVGHPVIIKWAFFMEKKCRTVSYSVPTRLKNVDVLMNTDNVVFLILSYQHNAH